MNWHQCMLWKSLMWKAGRLCIVYNVCTLYEQEIPWSFSIQEILELLSTVCASTRRRAWGKIKEDLLPKKYIYWSFFALPQEQSLYLCAHVFMINICHALFTYSSHLWAFLTLAKHIAFTWFLVTAADSHFVVHIPTFQDDNKTFTGKWNDFWQHLIC